MKYKHKKEEYWKYMLYENYHNQLIQLGDIVLMKENKRDESYCLKNENFFDFGIQNAVCGRSKYQENGELKGECFSLKKFKVIQME